MESNKWANWDDIVPFLAWVPVGEFTVDESWLRPMTTALASAGERRVGQDGEYVNPALVVKKTLNMVTEKLRCPPKPGQSSLHGRQFTRCENPVVLGEHLSVVARVPEKFVRRGRQYMIYEAWVTGRDLAPRMYWKMTRMVSTE